MRSEQRGTFSYFTEFVEWRRPFAEATVAKAGIKMLFPIVLFILPALS